MIEEAKAFDHQILDRIKNGHVPDLRHNQRVEWFYNNVWRDPVFVNMTFGENLRYLESFLKRPSKVLEVGCGPGHLSLELARLGHHVTGVDLSPECIAIAKKTAADNKFKDSFGSLEYLCGDFCQTPLPDNKFDAVLFYGSLSHFPKIDDVLTHIQQALKPAGQILVWDTSVDHYDKGDAAILYLIRSLLSHTGHFFRRETLTADSDEIEKNIHKVLCELQYVGEDGKNLQSENDNSQTYKSLMESLSSRFTKVAFEWESSLSRLVMGGIRFTDHSEEHRVASFLKKIDRFLIDAGKLNPAFFYYVGKKN